MIGTLRERSSERPLAGRIHRARGVLAQTIGLLGRRDLEPGEGMWFDGVNAVHTFGMRMSIDVVFLDRAGIVVKVASDLRPWRSAMAPGARDVLELAAGACVKSGIVPGMELEMQWHSST